MKCKIPHDAHPKCRRVFPQRQIRTIVRYKSYHDQSNSYQEIRGVKFVRTWWLRSHLLVYWIWPLVITRKSDETLAPKVKWSREVRVCLCLICKDEIYITKLRKKLINILKFNQFNFYLKNDCISAFSTKCVTFFALYHIFFNEWTKFDLLWIKFYLNVNIQSS